MEGCNNLQALCLHVADWWLEQPEPVTFAQLKNHLSSDSFWENSQLRSLRELGQGVTDKEVTKDDPLTALWLLVKIEVNQMVADSITTMPENIQDADLKGLWQHLIFFKGMLLELIASWKKELLECDLRQDEIMGCVLTLSMQMTPPRQ